MKLFGIENRSSLSAEEKYIESFLKENGINFKCRDRTVIKPLELDFILPDFNVAIEYNGLYWHSDIFKEDDYHLKKHFMCVEKGIRLISINEDEWHEKSNVIKSKILNLVGKSDKGLPAHKLQLRTITSLEANEFCNQYHIQGEPISELIYSIGAFAGNELIGIMSFSEINSEIEIVRFCHDGMIYNGLFSKMLNYVKEHNFWKKIIAYADLRYSEGNVYEVNGFKAVDILEPDYKFTKNYKTFDKNIFSKEVLKNVFDLEDHYINSTSLEDIMKDNGFFKIYDCGKIKYILEI